MYERPTPLLAQDHVDENFTSEVFCTLHSSKIGETPLPLPKPVLLVAKPSFGHPKLLQSRWFMHAKQALTMCFEHLNHDFDVMFVLVMWCDQTWQLLLGQRGGRFPPILLLCRVLGPLHYISSGRGQAVRIVTCQHQTWGKEKRQRQAVLVQLVNDFHNLYRTQLKIT